MWLSWMHASVKENIHICEKGGNVLFLTDQDYNTLRSSGVNIESFECVERVLTREDLWTLKRTYSRATL